MTKMNEEHVHTPGPWETSRDAVPVDHVQTTVYAESDGERVATVFRTEANAYLIAAAPELLDALLGLMAATCDDHGDDVCECGVTDPAPCAYCAANNAINKAQAKE